MLITGADRRATILFLIGVSSLLTEPLNITAGSAVVPAVTGRHGIPIPYEPRNFTAMRYHNMAFVAMSLMLRFLRVYRGVVMAVSTPAVVK